MMHGKWATSVKNDHPKVSTGAESGRAHDMGPNRAFCIRTPFMTPRPRRQGYNGTFYYDERSASDLSRTNLTVRVDSSAARIPFPRTARACAVDANASRCVSLSDGCASSGCDDGVKWVSVDDGVASSVVAVPVVWPVIAYRHRWVIALMNVKPVGVGVFSQIAWDMLRLRSSRVFRSYLPGKEHYVKF